ncbi:hypothetical protein C1X65_17180 [Pseudomonas sp. FW305-70]|nr:hypothetical protein C1X65_17180 [Pseudomonas sp. FW305-70]
MLLPQPAMAGCGIGAGWTRYLSFPAAIDSELALCMQECRLKAQASNEQLVALGGIGVGVINS